jgi:hypothetical protein
LIVQKYGDVGVNDIQMNFTPSNKNPRKRFKNILNILISSFRGARYRMLNKDDNFWPD